MIVEVHEVRDAFATVVGRLYGYTEWDGPFDPTAAPANVDLRPFSIAIPSTSENGTRDRAGATMDVVTRVVVRVHAPVHLAGPSRLAAATTEYKAEPLLIRALMAQDGDWNRGMRVAYRSTTREFLPVDEWLQTDHAFDVRHTVQL